MSTNTQFTPSKGELGVYEPTTYYANIVEDDAVTISYIPVLNNIQSTVGGTVTRSMELVSPISGTASGSTAEAKAGYEFKGWSTSTSISDIFDDTNATLIPTLSSPYQDQTYYAIFAAKQNVTINYSIDGGENGGGYFKDGTSTKYAMSETVSPIADKVNGQTAIAKPGYRFVKWVLDDTAETLVSTNANFVPSRNKQGEFEAASYIAKFEEDDAIKIFYKVYNNVGGTVSPGVEQGRPISGPFEGAKATAADGYKLDKWINSNGTKVAEGTVETFVPQHNSDGVYVADTYYAVFVESENVTINYATVTESTQAGAVGGSVNPSSEPVAPVSGIAKGSIASVNDGYEFIGWTKGENGTLLSTNLTYVPTKSKLEVWENGVTYYAHFKAKGDVTYRYIARAGGSVEPGVETISPTSTDALGGSTATPDSKLYEFVNWTDAAGNEVSTEAHFTPQKEGSLYTGGIFYANFKQKDNVTIQYKVINDNGDESNTVGTLNRSNETIAPYGVTPSGAIATAKPGYTFKGWYTNADHTEGHYINDDNPYVPSTNNDGLYESKTYYAWFTESDEVKVTFEARGGGSIDPYGEFNIKPITGTLSASTATANNGYHFVSWSKYDPTTNKETIVSTNESGIYQPTKAATDAWVDGTKYIADFSENNPVKIYYIALEGGTTSPTYESIKPVTGVAQGSIATANAADGYIFDK